jgi:hypothetical protein
MAYMFRLKGVDTVNKCQWCRDNIGLDREGWHWDLDQNANKVWPYTDVLVFIEDKEHATLFKLTWGDEYCFNV